MKNTQPLNHYMTLASRHPLLTAEEERDLARRWREHGEAAAAERLVLGNLRGVVKIAGEFRNPHVNFEDLVQEGNVGLMRAVDRFDPDRGVRFVTYAGWWIRASIREYLLRTRSLVRLGTTQKQRAIYSRLGRARQELERKYPDCDPAKRLGRLARILDQDPALVEQMESRLNGHDLSLHTRVGDDGETSYLDLLADSGPDVEEITGERQVDVLRVAELDQAMGDLSQREQFIIHHRFRAPSRRTLRDLGEEMGISRERVRQLEKRALGRIRDTLSNRPFTQELAEDEALIA